MPHGLEHAKNFVKFAKQPTAYIFSFYHPIIQHFTEIQAYIKPTWSLQSPHGEYLSYFFREPLPLSSVM